MGGLVIMHILPYWFKLGLTLWAIYTFIAMMAITIGDVLDRKGPGEVFIDSQLLLLGMAAFTGAVLLFYMAIWVWL